MKLTESIKENPQDYFVYDLVDWFAATAYVVGDRCFHNGEGYKCIADNTDQEPGIAANWFDYWSLLSPQQVYVKPNRDVSSEYPSAKAFRKKVFSRGKQKPGPLGHDSLLGNF